MYILCAVTNIKMSTIVYICGIYRVDQKPVHFHKFVTPLCDDVGKRFIYIKCSELCFWNDANIMYIFFA